MPDLMLANGYSVEVNTSGPPAVELPVTADTNVSVLLATGPPGPRGVSGGGFVHVQASAAAQWTVVHNLGTVIDPAIVLDSEPGRPVWADVTYPDLNTAVITLPSPVTGSAYF